MLNPYKSILLALPILALATACSSPVTAVEQPPPTPRVTEVPNVSSAPPSNDSTPVGTPTPGGQPQTGVSSRTTPGHVWAEPIIDGGTVTISRTVARMGDHVHFEVPDGDTFASFIGYFVGPAFLVRPCICPTCGDEGVDWGASELTCQSCAAAYDTVTGTSRQGGVCYPAGLIPSRIAVDSITMLQNDLLLAYQRTVAREATMFERATVPGTDGGDGSLPACCPGH